jgi:hypothetical protein
VPTIGINVVDHPVSIDIGVNEAEERCAGCEAGGCGFSFVFSGWSFRKRLFTSQHLAREQSARTYESHLEIDGILHQPPILIEESRQIASGTEYVQLKLCRR